MRTTSDTAAAAGILMRLFRGPATIGEIVTFSKEDDCVPLDRRRVTAALFEMMDVVDRSWDADPVYSLSDYGVRVLAQQDRPLDVMREVADDLVVVLSPHATRLEVGGSLRRECDRCGDIELVALVDGERDLFGHIVEAQDTPLAGALRGLAYVTVRSGPRYTQALVVHPDHGPVTVDLFVTQDPECWGRLFFVRTGSADFVQRADRHFKRQTSGSLEGLRYYDAAGVVLDTRQECDVFALLRCPVVSPCKRVARPSRTL